jgi:hypothetical protein
MASRLVGCLGMAAPYDLAKSIGIRAPLNLAGPGVDVGLVDWTWRGAHDRRARFVQLSREPRHRTTVPPGPDGRPGERLITPSLNQHASQIATDGSRNDLAILLGHRGSMLFGVCLGVRDGTGPTASAEHTIAQFKNRRIGSCIEAPSNTKMVGCDAVTYVLQRNNGQVLREWKFLQEGWLFAVGILRHPRDRRGVESLGLRSLDTWQWIPGTEGTVVSQALPEPVVEVTEITESIVTTASIETVWTLIRDVEHNRLLHKNFVDAFHVPGTPKGVGEHQAVVLKFPGYRRTFTSIIVEETPPARLVTRTHGVNDSRDQQIYTLDTEHGRTRLTLSFRYSLGIDLAAREWKARGTREAMHEYLRRVADVLAKGCDGRDPE